jgi:mono/diheme cytochrome c family protein
VASPTVAPSTAVGSAAGALPEPEPGIPPAGTTGRMTALGDSIFHGQAAGGTCFTCHGPDAKGTPLAPSLVDHEWLTGNGSLAFIVQRVTQGMPTPTAPFPGPMLPMGGAQLTTDQVRAVAAYIASISHSKG